MEKIFKIFLWIFILGCGAASSEIDTQIAKESESSESLEFEAESPEKEILTPINEMSSNDQLPPNLKEKLGAHLNSFVEENLDSYDCEIIDQYYGGDLGTKLNIEGLIQIDSISCDRLFNMYQNRYGDFCNSYFYSKDQPINGLFPITIIQQFGVIERPLIMVLFNEFGEIMNSIEVADSYGQIGGCLSSKRINDSMLIQNASYQEFGIDTGTGEDVWETEYVETQITIRSNGEIIEKELKRSKSVDE